MLTIDFIGIFATLVDILNLWPQYAHIRKTNETGSYSVTHLKVSLFTSILWLTYAVVKRDWIFMATGMVGLMFTLYLLYKVKQRKKHA